MRELLYDFECDESFFSLRKIAYYFLDWLRQFSYQRRRSYYTFFNSDKRVLLNVYYLDAVFAFKMFFADFVQVLYSFL